MKPHHSDTRGFDFKFSLLREANNQSILSGGLMYVLK